MILQILQGAAQLRMTAGMLEAAGQVDFAERAKALSHETLNLVKIRDTMTETEFVDAVKEIQKDVQALDADIQVARLYLEMERKGL